MFMTFCGLRATPCHVHAMFVMFGTFQKHYAMYIRYVLYACEAQAKRFACHSCTMMYVPCVILHYRNHDDVIYVPCNIACDTQAKRFACQPMYNVIRAIFMFI